MTNYSELKTSLKIFSIESKNRYKGDKPAVRMDINDFCDYLIKSNNLSDHKQNLLSDYAGTLHP